MNGLVSAVSDLLPAPPVPSLPFTVQVLPTRVGAVGIGGFVGPHHTPQGEIMGRRVDARVIVGVQARGDADLGEAVASVAMAIAGRDAARARSGGLLRVALSEVGPETTTGSGNNMVRRKEVEFVALYEYLHLPTEAGDVIGTVPVFLDVGSTGDGGRILFRARFTEGALDAFEPVDDPGAATDAPSHWEVDVAEGAIRQAARIRGGDDTPGPDKPGGQLLLRQARMRAPAADLIVTTGFRSGSPEGVGLIFRWLDVDNFYFALLDAGAGYRFLGKKIAGNFSMLEEGGVDTTQSFEQERLHALRISAQGDAIRMHLDGELALAGRDRDLAGPGRVGFLTRGNDAAHFYSLDVVAL